jgi:transcriptional regulator with XRE-family HTH domain
MTRHVPRIHHNPDDVASRRELAKRLRQVRENLGMTQRDVADDIGVTAGMVRRIECFHSRDPIIVTVQRHARGLDRAVRFRLILDGAADLPEYPTLPPSDADARHRADVLGQLTAARHRFGLTQAMVGAAMGATKDVVQVIESGAHEPLLSTFQRYARALGDRLAAQVVPAPTVDGVAIDLALEGKRRFGILSDAEKVVLFRDRVARQDWNRAAVALRISGETARLWQKRAEVAA